MRAILDIAFSHVRHTLNGRGALFSTFVVPIIMLIFLGSAFSGSGAVTGQVYDVVRASAPGDDLALRFVDVLRAEGHKQYQGKDHFIVCDLSQSTEQPAECKLASVPANSDLAALARSRLDDGISNALIIF